MQSLMAIINFQDAKWLSLCPTLASTQIKVVQNHCLNNLKPLSHPPSGVVQRLVGVGERVLVAGAAGDGVVLLALALPLRPSDRPLRPAPQGQE